jgi:hypothetical protein
MEEQRREIEGEATCGEADMDILCPFCPPPPPPVVVVVVVAGSSLERDKPKMLLE